jgi:SAM-dependent methyltransferase
VTSALRELRRDWDERARRDPLYWSCVRESWRGSRDIEECLEEGRADAVALLAPALARLGFDPRGKRLLDVGAGFGRMFRGYAELGFGEIVGAEISLEMARLGMQWRASPHARFVAIDGVGLAALRDARFDCVVSRGVLPHQQRTSRMWSLVAEISRVLAPGGVFVLHLGGRRLGPLRSALHALAPGLAVRPDPARERELAETTPAPSPAEALSRLAGMGLEDVHASDDPKRSSRRHPRFYVSGRKPATR